MREPRFWNKSKSSIGIRSRLLSPLAMVYASLTARRVRKTGIKADIPVICVGNINAGGTGKTPTVIAVVLRLAEMGLKPHVVSRGYKGSLLGPIQVSEKLHDANEVGDEPLLLAAFCPTWVSKDRAAGVQKAQAAGADIIVLDDGFQNPAVEKDISIVVVDAARGFGNGQVIPAGPLRERVPAGMARADLVLSIGDEQNQAQFINDWAGDVTVKHMTGELIPLQTGMDWQKLRVLAFAGIGHPDKFFATLDSLGAILVRAEALDDHQTLSETLMKRLEADAAVLGAQLVTTEKDAVRLPASFQSKVLTVPVRLEISDWTAFDDALKKALPNAS